MPPGSESKELAVKSKNTVLVVSAANNTRRYTKGFRTIKMCHARLHDDYQKNVNVQKEEKHHSPIVPASRSYLNCNMADLLEFVQYNVEPNALHAIPFDGPSCDSSFSTDESAFTKYRHPFTVPGDRIRKLQIRRSHAFPKIAFAFLFSRTSHR